MIAVHICVRVCMADAYDRRRYLCDTDTLLLAMLVKQTSLFVTIIFLRTVASVISIMIVKRSVSSSKSLNLWC